MLHIFFLILPVFSFHCWQFGLQHVHPHQNCLMAGIELVSSFIEKQGHVRAWHHNRSDGSQMSSVTIGSLSFTFPGTANGKFELSWQNFC
jgi:hypothetical protein